VCGARYLWLRADHRKRGYATALMEAAEFAYLQSLNTASLIYS
jgi:GNAT superfamily N-acetyltransferase